MAQDRPAAAQVAAQAQDAGNRQEDALAEIIVIGDRAELLSVPGSGAVIDEEDLKRAQVFTINEALRQAPGVFAREEEGLGIRPNIGIRGLNPVRSTKVMLLEDGIPLGLAPYGDNSYYYHPPIERFARIEILKGASQIRFGPQTIGGVINYITPEAPSEAMAEIMLAGGNGGYLELDGIAGGPALGGRILFYANRKESDGNRKNQELELTDFYVKGEWDLGEAQAVTARLSHFREDSQLTYSGLTQGEFAADPRGNPFGKNDEFETRRWSATLSHGWEINPSLKLLTTGYYHFFNRDWWRQSSNSLERPNDASDPLCGGMANLSTTCGTQGNLRSYYTYGVEARLTVDHGAFGLAGQTELGARYHNEKQRRRQIRADTPTSRIPGTTVNGGIRENQVRFVDAYALFAQSEFAFGPLSVQPGIRAELIDYERVNLPISVLVADRPTGALTTTTRGKSYLDEAIPGVGATLALNKQIALYGGVHRGFAPPRVEDVITTAGGTVDLDAEKSWNYELGVRGEFLPGLHADFTVFQMDFSNQIIAASVAGGVGATLTSAGKTKHRGLEASSKFSSRDARLTSNTDLFGRFAVTLVADANFDSTRIATPPCFGGGTTGAPVLTARGPVPCNIALNVNGNRLPYSPDWLYSAAVGAQVGWFTGQVEVQGQSSAYGDDVNLIPVTPDGQRGRLPGWAIINATLNIEPPQSALSGFVTVKNIFDKLYIVDRARGILPGTPFLVQAGVKARF